VESRPSFVRKGDIEDEFIRKLTSLKYIHRTDVHDLATVESNFRKNNLDITRYVSTAKPEPCLPVREEGIRKPSPNKDTSASKSTRAWT
jgi:hypothetical protein